MRSTPGSRSKNMSRRLPAGFRKAPKLDAQKRVYRGRLVCPAVQWTGTGSDAFCTFTVTAAEIADASAGSMLWTDQAVQRGIKPGLLEDAPRELSLSTGYPDSRYIFDAENANDMVEKILNASQLYLNPLIWNLRPGTFDAFLNDDLSEIYVYSGRIYLPDSHHRHQAIIKAVDIYRLAPEDYPKFTDDKEFKVELYFLSRESEGDYFFDKNQRPKPAALSKAFDLSTQDDLSMLAKNVIEHSSNLKGNVNRVTDRLAKSNSQVITLSTLREMMRTYASSDYVEASEFEGLSIVAAQFYDLLTEVRPELGQLGRTERNLVRERLLVDSAVMMHGYAYLMKDYNASIGKDGTRSAEADWRAKLKRLAAEHQYRYGPWTGDLLSKDNPLWEAVGVIRRRQASGSRTVLNTGAARGTCGRVLRQLLAVDGAASDLSFLALA